MGLSYDSKKIYNGTSKNIFQSSKVKESYPSICDNVVRNLDLKALHKKNLNKLMIAHLNGL